MSIMSEYTIETNLAKTEAINKLKANTQDTNTNGILSFVRKETDLPFYGMVDDDKFKIHLAYKDYSTHMMMALEGNIEDEYDSTKIYIKPKGMSPLMLISTIGTPIFMFITAYLAVTYGSLPIDLILPPFSIVAVLSVVMMIGYSHYYIHKAKKALQELFKS